MTFPVFDPLPVPEFVVPDRIKEREAAALEQAADQSSSGTTRAAGRSRRSSEVPAPVPAVVQTAPAQEQSPSPAPTEPAPLPAPARPQVP